MNALKKLAEETARKRQVLIDKGLKVLYVQRAPTTRLKTGVVCFIWKSCRARNT